MQLITTNRAIHDMVMLLKSDAEELITGIFIPAIVLRNS
jgi:hypothetical protein